MDSLTMKPEEIEAGSFRIIEAEAGEHGRAQRASGRCCAG